MAQKKGKKKLDIEDLERIKSPNYVSVYANNTNATSSFNELRLFFGQIVHRPYIDPIIEDSVTVTMTWEHALRVRELLDRMLKSYSHGPIRELDKEPTGPVKIKKKT